MDTIRTRLQTSRNFSGVVDCCVKTVRNEVQYMPSFFAACILCWVELTNNFMQGFKALYKGVGTPLVFQVCFSVLFACCSRVLIVFVSVQGVYKTVMFSSYTFAMRFFVLLVECFLLLGKYCCVAYSVLKNSKTDKLGAFGIAACGGFAGGINSLVVTPVELVRNRFRLFPAFCLACFKYD